MCPANYKIGCETRTAAIVASANEEFRKRILRRLGARSWTVEEAMGGAEALSMIEDGTFGALLLDRWLPDLEVQELVDLIKLRHPRVQVLVLGSEAEECGLVEKLSLHVDLPSDFPRAQDSVEWEIGAEGLGD